MYRITYEQGNGYQCSCCRRTRTETEDLSTPEKVQDWVNELYASQEAPKYEDEDDRTIESIEKEFGVDIQNEFLPNEKEVERKIKVRKKYLAARKKREKLEDIKRREERERFEYLRLKEKYEDCS